MSGTRNVSFDPRAKLLMLLLCILCATTAPNLTYELGLVLMIAFLGLLCGKWRYALGGFLFYAVIFLLTRAALSGTVTTFTTTLIAFFGLVHKVYPCGYLAGIIISTTRISEFLSAMYRLRVPRSIVIPMAVMLRYIPAVREDWRFIKDAMRLRDVSPSLGGILTRPAMTVECLYVPLMMSASRTADELSIASVTRGIENPKPRTCLTQIRFGPKDGLAALCFAAYFIAGRFM